MLSVDELKLNQEKVEEAYSDDEEVADMDIQGTYTRDVHFLDTYRNLDIRDTDIQGGFNKKQEGRNVNQDELYEEDDMIGEQQPIKEMDKNGLSDFYIGQEDYYEEEYEEEKTTDSNAEVRVYTYKYEQVCMKLHVNV